ncbi:MAG: hypothetical protein K6U11_07005 [bacterium]|nr:hypothetical protein [bacterium]
MEEFELFGQAGAFDARRQDKPVRKFEPADIGSLHRQVNEDRLIRGTTFPCAAWISGPSIFDCIEDIELLLDNPLNNRGNPNACLEPILFWTFYDDLFQFYPLLIG